MWSDDEPVSCFIYVQQDVSELTAELESAVSFLVIQNLVGCRFQRAKNQLKFNEEKLMLDNNFAFAVVHSQFPHVGHRLKDHWDEPDFPNVIEDLLNPDPKRQGFPSGVLNALRSLALMHELEVTYSKRLDDQPQLSLNLEH